MTLLEFLLVVVIIGVVLYLINRFVPMESNIKAILNWVVIIFIILLCLKVLGVFSALSSVTL